MLRLATLIVVPRLLPDRRWPPVARTTTSRRPAGACTGRDHVERPVAVPRPTPSSGLAPALRAPKVIGTVATGLEVAVGHRVPARRRRRWSPSATRPGAAGRGAARVTPRSARSSEAAAPTARPGCSASPSRRRTTRDHRVFFYVSTADDNRVLRTTFDGRQARRARRRSSPASRWAATTTAAGWSSARTGCSTSPPARPASRDLAQDRELAGRQDPADHPGRQARRPGNPFGSARSGPTATATCRGWPSTTPAACGPRSSARTPSTS